MFAKVKNMWASILIGSIVTLGIVLRIILAVQVAKRTRVHPVRYILNMWLCQPDGSPSLKRNIGTWNDNDYLSNPRYQIMSCNIYNRR